MRERTAELLRSAPFESAFWDRESQLVSTYDRVLAARNASPAMNGDPHRD